LEKNEKEKTSRAGSASDVGSDQRPTYKNALRVSGPSDPRSNFDLVAKKAKRFFGNQGKKNWSLEPRSRNSPQIAGRTLKGNLKGKT